MLHDLIIRLKNSSKQYKKKTLVKKTNEGLNVLFLLYREGYIDGFKIISFKLIMVYLKYYHELAAFNIIKCISKPSKSYYVPFKFINKFNICVLTTSKGIMFNKTAKLLGLGGKILFIISV